MHHSDIHYEVYQITEYGHQSIEYSEDPEFMNKVIQEFIDENQMENDPITINQIRTINTNTIIVDDREAFVVTKGGAENEI